MPLFFIEKLEVISSKIWGTFFYAFYLFSGTDPLILFERHEGDQNKCLNLAGRTVCYDPVKLTNHSAGTKWTVFKWSLKVITTTRLRLLFLVIGLKISRHFFSQLEAQWEPIAHCTRDFPALWASFGLTRCLLCIGFSTVTWKPLDNKREITGIKKRRTNQSTTSNARKRQIV